MKDEMQDVGGTLKGPNTADSTRRPVRDEDTQAKY